MIRRLWNAGLLMVLTTAPALVWAAQPPPAVEGFVPVRPEDMVREQLPAAPLVYAAYAFVWLALIVYVFSIWRRLGRVERDLSEVHARLKGRA